MLPPKLQCGFSLDLPISFIKLITMLKPLFFAIIVHPAELFIKVLVL
jgi:hypothetical protein